jgi:hypothetical protein
MTAKRTDRARYTPAAQLIFTTDRAANIDDASLVGEIAVIIARSIVRAITNPEHSL